MKSSILLMPLAVALTATACANHVTTNDAASSSGQHTATATSGGSGGQGGDSYLLDFAIDRPGLEIGFSANFAFSVDTTQAVRNIDLKRQGSYTEGEGVIVSFDFTSGCEGKDKAVLEMQLASLPAGTPANIDHVDVEFVPAGFPSDPNQEAAQETVCFGYREPGGTWHWVADETPAVYDAQSGHMINHLQVKHGPIDAIKIVPKTNRVMARLSYVLQSGT